ncbi:MULTISPECIES: peptidoglycan recognition family protein [unclassified Nostoc]|uniref:peptidoglycan recognition protein family protein n=1 Tax=unclassified Nostoc TaxID=2593658 RepID=UPI0025AAAF89|nr:MULTISPECIES: peptidoglycan recognition family protein [unclassified Nostoc]MDM9583982.1 peptidoglycan recognition family protein [Nostoc sp. GT001]MDZ7945024.1 peptidoglycan recognition family protein [Nostoc sp. EfeVER01]MDZ7991621.1 peptidoglycan recognition family protein [Nostoc sp. EspVER01]
MKFTDWVTRVLLIWLMFATLIVVLLIGRATKLHNNPTISRAANPQVTAFSKYPQAQFQSAKEPEKKFQNVIKSPVKTNQPVARYVTTQAFAQYRPNYEVVAVNPTNYGERYAQDANGLPLNNQPIIVIHETGYSASSAINFFQVAHDDESVQASYHALIKLDGTVVYLVPPEKRAFGAANSVFETPQGVETVQTNPTLPASVNNFAYHVSLETPPDSYDASSQQTHSGYTEAQYNSLAWLIAQSQVPDDRITTHKLVDRSSKKVDPINFDGNKFLSLLNTYRQVRPVYRVSK